MKFNKQLTMIPKIFKLSRQSRSLLSLNAGFILQADNHEQTGKYIFNQIFILSLLIILSIGNSYSQTTNFTHFGIEDGMPQSQVQTIEQDDDGNLWIGTMSGLSKYNGVSFTNYTKNDSLAEDWITASFKDKSGDLWFGHWGGGVSKYDSKNKKFRNLDFDIISNFKTITAIFEDESGRFWFGTNGAGVYRYDLQNNRVIVISSDEALSGDHVSSICQDNHGNIWIGTENGITIYDTQKEIYLEEAFNYLNIEKGLINNKITDISLVFSDEIWIGTEDAGIIIIKLNESQSLKDIESIDEALTININADNGLASNNISIIYEDNENTVWIGTKDAGITQFIPASSERKERRTLAKGTFKTFSTQQGLNYHHINNILQDREGNYWIGTEVGLNKYRSDRFQIYDESDGLVNNIVWSILEDSKGNLWFGTNNGISKFIPDKGIGAIQHFAFHNYTSKDGLPDNIILSMCEDNEGNIWFGTANGGAVRLSGGYSDFRTFTTGDGLPDNTINTINIDDDGDLWLGTKKGLARFDPKNSSFITYSMRDGLGGNNIYRIFNDSKGNLWFGILGGNLTKYDGNSFTIFDESDGIKHNFILSITEDNSGNLWLGAYGGGLYKYDPEEKEQGGGIFTNYSKKHGLSSESPSSIICDNENNIWIGTSKGIDKFDQQNNTFTHYGKKEGFLGIETNANAVCKDVQGCLWFGTIMGAVKFDPAKDKPNIAEPFTSITKLRIHLIDAGFPENATFPYNKNHLAFHFLGISLTNPDMVSYKYKLDGFDEEWTPATKENYVIYSNLSHGDYKFLVTANNGEGIWNEQPITYNFNITPPFWRTFWFYGFCIIFAAGAFYLFDKIRTAKLKKEKAILEEKVRERTIELAEKNQELAEKNEDITASIRYAKRIQEAILPPDSMLRDNYPHSFILFKPKDIVSGDFYWIEKKDNKLMFAAVDCTGHGVPGAFMSIIGHNILSQSIHEHHIFTPGKILDNLNKGVSQTLRQSEKEYHTVKDGMDLVLCSLTSIDEDENGGVMLEFAGAFNPLYLVRGNELIETKSDRQPIGAYGEEKIHPFTNHKIPLQKGDTIYIFSDGYVDQFGGERGKKFMSKRFKQLFLDIQKMSMEDQKEHLDKTIEEWRTNPGSPGREHDQIDDILVVGVRV
ncbi:MAG: two-component regulator propeller domain-containing protein [Bacteroidota bacterium]